jgi:hypothetical protein
MSCRAVSSWFGTGAFQPQCPGLHNDEGAPAGRSEMVPRPMIPRCGDPPYLSPVKLGVR